MLITLSQRHHNKEVFENFSVMIDHRCSEKIYASTGVTETKVLLFLPFLNSTTPSANANKE